MNGCFSTKEYVWITVRFFVNFSTKGHFLIIFFIYISQYWKAALLILKWKEHFSFKTYRALLIYNEKGKFWGFPQTWVSQYSNLLLQFEDHEGNCRVLMKISSGFLFFVAWIYIGLDSTCKIKPRVVVAVRHTLTFCAGIAPKRKRDQYHWTFSKPSGLGGVTF